MNISPDTIIIITPPGKSAAVAQNSLLLTNEEIAQSLRELAEQLHPRKKE